MADSPDWPKVLSLTVHELRTPLTVVAGYLRMLSTDRVGPLSDAQRRVIEEAERSCARLSDLVSEMSEVAHFHQGRVSFLRSPVGLAGILDAVRLTDGSGRPIRLEHDGLDAITVEGDATRLRHALSAVATATGREIMDGEPLFVLASTRQTPAGRLAVVAMGSETAARHALAAASLPPFDATRGGSGLSLIIARQVLEQHGATVWGSPDDQGRAGATVVLPI
jgi:signal transduction histidine kinase